MDYPINNQVPRDITLTVTSQNITNTSRSGRVQAGSDGPDRIGFKLEYNRGTFNGSADELRPLWVFLARCRGQLNTFDVQLPWYSYGTGAAVAPGSVAAITETGYSVPTSGWVADSTVRKAGDFIQFSGGSRAYMLAEDLVADASGNAVAELCSPLIRPVAAGEQVVISGIKFRCRLDADTASITQNPGRLQQIKTVGIVEDIYA